MEIVPACKSQCKSKNRDNSALFLLTDQVIANSQNKWKEGWIKSAENWKQNWINSALKFKCSSKWLKEMNFRNYKDSAGKLYKKILEWKWQNKYYE